MPSLFRFLVFVGVIVGLGYGAIFALANFTDPGQREITVIIPQNALNKHR